MTRELLLHSQLADLLAIFFLCKDSAKPLIPAMERMDLSNGRFLHMRKKTIVLLFSVGFGLYFLGAMAVMVSAVILSSAQQGCVPNCDPASTTGLVFLIVMSGLASLAGYIMFMIAWIATLVKQAQRKQWAWFVCTLLFSGICMLIWLIVEPEVAQYIVPFYPPGYPYPPTPAYSPEAQYYHQEQQFSQPYRQPQE